MRVFHLGDDRQGGFPNRLMQQITEQEKVE